ncbi:hypothetical protein [Bradyrhizobium sp. 191]|uniref:hypothetical protein n=1 Tax=Bradyrhizobium sp. 191 TaxID=2782659 RepID=UPI001FFEF67E|nr:hypothetical protein [Bradyrhizobium sp. 191]UPJ65021.1 hypothetical protein IVB23_34660 [Bradyrhizobium sp. 191]
MAEIALNSRSSKAGLKHAVRADRQKRLMDSFAPGSDDWVQAERLLVNFESPAQFIESFCHRMRRRVNDHPLRERPEPH